MHDFIRYIHYLDKQSKRIKRIKVEGLSQTENWKIYLAGGGTVNGSKRISLAE